MPYANELDAALTAARSAGRALRDLYQQFQAIPDAPASISTDADRQSQEIILTYLRERFPNDALCAEEATATLAAAARTGDRLWIVDPIDGTRGFARKNGEFSVMIGFVDHGETAVGVVLEPALQRLTYAVRGGGCWRADGERNLAEGATLDSIPCRVREQATLAQATLTQSRPRNAGAPTPTALAIQPARVVETYSAGIKLAQVARGEVDLYVNSYEAFHDWDICAGHILVTEAGGRVTGIADETLRYGLPGAWQRHGLLASNGRLHAAAVAALRSMTR
jgi:3'(2'), 5'-bisphosphate nucleotidase